MKNAQPTNYTVGVQVAKGGMGAILSTRDNAIGRTVAMKVMLAREQVREADRLRFNREAQILGQLEHPNVVPIHELGVDEQGQPYYTMKLVRGVTLKDVINRLKTADAEMVAKYPLTQLLTVFQKVCDAVAFAHSKGVVHRDLKPENIMLGDFGEVLVLDWGLAKILEGSAGASLAPSGAPPEGTEEGIHETDDLRPPSGSGYDLTLEGTILGTPQFMAPEQAEGRITDIDERTDIFSLGGILYSLLTLRPPTGGTTIKEVLANIKSGYIPPPLIYNKARKRTADGSELESAIELVHCPGGRIPDSLSAVCMKAMAVDPEARYQTVPELQAEISAYQGGFATGAEGAGAWRQFVLFLKRNKTVSIATALLLVLAFGFTVRVVHERDRANTALAELQGSVPLIEADIQKLIATQQFESALKRVSQLLALMPTESKYHRLQGDMLQSLFRFREAQAAYEQALRLNRKEPFAEANRDLSARLSHQSGAKGSSATLTHLQEEMNRQGRFSEAVAIGERTRTVGVNHEKRLADYRQTVRQHGFPEEFLPRLAMDGEGRLTLNLGGLAKISDLSAFRGLPLVSISIDGTKVQDLTPLNGMPLQEFNAACTPIAELAPLKAMKLKSVGLQSCVRVTDITALQGMPLTNLNLESTSWRDPTVLKGMPLRSLQIGGDNLTNLSCLSGMPLEHLQCYHVRNLKDISPLRDLPLRHLTLYGCPAQDLSPLKGLKLETLNLSISGFTNISPLRGMRLTNLNLSTCYQIKDLSPLQGMPLEDLAVEHTAVRDLGPLKEMRLAGLSIYSTEVTDLSPLENMRLLALAAQGTKISDLRPLRGMPLTSLTLQSTSVNDVSPLRGMPLKQLRLGSCSRLQDIGPLADCKELELLEIPVGAKGIEVLRGLPKLKKLAYALPENSWDKVPPIEEFWKAYDARKGKK